jgi:hypothetical protein
MTASWALAASASTAPAPNPDQTVLLDTRKIWDAGRHNAFTDLIRWHNRWWCTFRESEAHVGGDGRIRVITSPDGQTWESAALVAEKDIDLRDPKFSIMPDDRLMIVCGGSVYLGTRQLKSRQPRVMFSRDGRNWTVPQKVLGEADWLWRVTWLRNKAYGTSYKATASANTNRPAQSPAQSGSDWPLKLYSSGDGLKWDLVSTLKVPDRPNETTLRFLPGGDLMAMVRREAGNCMGWIGLAHPPYQQWTWNESNYRFGGPNFIQLPDGSLIAGTRDYGHPPKFSTLIARLTENKLLPLLTLPSGGDNSYPGLVWHEGTLWVSYYSSHEGKTSIYLARVKLPAG